MCSFHFLLLLFVPILTRKKDHWGLYVDLLKELQKRIIELDIHLTAPIQDVRISGSSGGFRLPNKDGDVRAPDVAFILAQRLPRTTENYAELVPDLMFEIKSKTDSLDKLRQKIQEFWELGTKVGVLVDPRTRTMEVHRLNEKTVVLNDEDVLELPEVLPGWKLPVVEVWAPEFE